MLLPARKAAELLGLPYSTLRDLGLRGKLPVVKVGRAWYFRRTDLTEWVKNCATIMNQDADYKREDDEALVVQMMQDECRR